MCGLAAFGLRTVPVVAWWLVACASPSSPEDNWCSNKELDCFKVGNVNENVIFDSSPGFEWPPLMRNFNTIFPGTCVTLNDPLSPWTLDFSALPHQVSRDVRANQRWH